jgi:hypothetical protein
VSEDDRSTSRPTIPGSGKVLECSLEGILPSSKELRAADELIVSSHLSQAGVALIKLWAKCRGVS